MSRRPAIRTDRKGSASPAPAGLLAGVLLAASLAGCGAPAPDLGSDAAKQLQTQVLAVSQAAAANDPAGSLKLLDGLLTRLDAAAANGEVSFKRHQSIKSSIDAVRADLTAQKAAADKAAAEKAAAARAAADKAAADKAAADRAAAAAAVAAVAPAPADGKAKGKGKGKG